MKLPMTMLALGGGLALVLAACDHEDRRTDAGEARSQADDGREAAQAASQAGPGIAQRAAAEDHGDIVLAMSGTPSSHVVDGAGSAVYMLAGNADAGLCDQACEEVWPPLLAHHRQPTAGTGVEQARIGTLDREGRIHVTYGGQPLYRYAGDMGANRTAGTDVEDQWGKWSLLGLDGRPLEAVQ